MFENVSAHGVTDEIKSLKDLPISGEGGLLREWNKFLFQKYKILLQCTPYLMSYLYDAVMAELLIWCTHRCYARRAGQLIISINTGSMGFFDKEVYCDSNPTNRFNALQRADAA